MPAQPDPAASARSSLHGSLPASQDRRPYRHLSETGAEVVHVAAARPSAPTRQAKTPHRGDRAVRR